jgi:hypothetical protein
MTIVAVLLAIGQVGAQVDKITGKRDFGFQFIRHLEVDSNVYKSFVIEYYIERMDSNRVQYRPFWTVKFDFATKIFSVNLGNVELGTYITEVNGKTKYWFFIGNSDNYLSSNDEDKYMMIPEIKTDNILEWTVKYAKLYMSDTYYDEATINDLEYIVTIYNDLNKDK